MSNIQTVLVIVVIALSALLFIVGLQVLMIIIDLRRSIKRLNTILEDAVLGGGLIRPEKLSSVLEFFRRKRDVHTHGQG